MQIHKVMAIFALSSILLGCATSMDKYMQTGAKPMTGAELQARFSKELKISWKSARGGSGTAVRRPDGTQTVDWGSGSDTGTWRIVGDTLCQQWTTVRGGKEYCLTIFQTGEGTYRAFNADGSFSSEARDM